MFQNLMKKSVGLWVCKQHTLFPRTYCTPVNCNNEWDTLEEIVVGRLEGACVPSLSVEMKAIFSESQCSFFQERGGGRFPTEYTERAIAEVENFCSVLKSEGVKVRRPEVTDFQKDYKTPDFYSSVGLYNAMPRDFMIVIGNDIIEAPMAWRSRFFEYRSYRSLFKQYFTDGAKWTAAPKPLMSDELYDSSYPDPSNPSARSEFGNQGKYVTTEFEPCFDAADFLRAGKDIFAHRSHVTNHSGIEWMQRHLGDEYRVHTLAFKNQPGAMHIDTSLIFIKPGLAILNPDRPLLQKELFEKAGWKLVDAPFPMPSSNPKWMSSAWLTINNLMLDEERIIVEKEEEDVHKFFENLGLKCIKIPFRHAYSYGGAFHCYTAEIRRKGKLDSYF